MARLLEYRETLLRDIEAAARKGDVSEVLASSEKLEMLASFMKRQQEEIARTLAALKDPAAYAPPSAAPASGRTKPKSNSHFRTKDTAGPKRRRGRYEVLGYPATAIFRWMGANGWTVKEAMKVVKHHKLGCSFYTVRGRIWFGRKGQAGAPAPLTPEQIASLNKIAGKP